MQSQDTNSVEIVTALLETARRQELRAGLVDIIYRRLTLLGIEDALVQRSNGNRLLIHIPKTAVAGNIEDADALIG